MTLEYTITGTLFDSDTGARIGDATEEQVWASIDAGEEGHIRVQQDGSLVVPGRTEYGSRRVWVDHALLSVTWGRIGAFLGGPHTGAAAEDDRLIAALNEATGRDLTPCEGTIDEDGWHLYLRDLTD